MSILPAPLRQALGRLTEGQARNALAVRSAAITAGYKARNNSSHTLLTADDALAYAIARMPATYAAMAQALNHVSDVMPTFEPHSVLDIGCGPGTVSFAAREHFACIKTITMLDRNGPFLELAKVLSEAALSGVSVGITAQDIIGITPLPKADMVVAGYVLAELSVDHQAALVQRMWDAADQLLLLVEPGTPDGFERLRTARIALIQRGATVSAPCTHENACMMAGDVKSGGNWCRFMARVQRSRDHKALKSADVPFEDEPYAYLALSKEKLPARPSQRIVSRTLENKFEIRLPVCGADGLSTITIPTRNKVLFKQVKRLGWGDAVLNPIQTVEVTP